MQPWVNGLPMATLGVANRGLAYGDGLFETIRVTAGQPRLLTRHLQRVAASAPRLALALDLAQLEHELLAYAQAMGEGVLKLTLTRGDSPRGYAFDPAAAPVRILQASPLPAWPASHAEQGVQLFPCQTRLARQPLLAGLKHLNRLEQVLARAEWQGNACAEGLMRDTEGWLIEGVFSNLFLVCDGVLCTAALDQCGVAGTLRAELLEAAPGLGVSTRVGELPWAALATAQEVFTCNSVYGLWPVIGCGELRWPVGALTRTLQRWAATLLDS